MNNSNQGADLVAQWRNGAGLNNPAGALFIGGEFAESDIMSSIRPTTLHGCGTACTGSTHRPCC